MTTANAEGSPQTLVRFRTDSGLVVALCRSCLVRVGRSERIEAATTLLAGLLLTTMIGALVVYLCAVGPQVVDESGWESLGRSLHGIGQVALSDGYAVLAVISALLIATTLNLSQISARLDSRPQTHAETPDIVDGRDARSLVRDGWSLLGEILLAFLCVMISALLGVTRVVADSGTSSRVFALVAGTLTAWGLLEVTRCRAVQRQASGIAEAEDRVRAHKLRVRVERLITATTESLRARILIIWWSFWVVGLMAVMIVWGDARTFSGAPAALIASVVFGGATLATSVLVGRSALAEVGFTRVLTLTTAVLVAAPVAGISAAALVGSRGVGAAGTIAAGISAAVAAVGVSWGSAGIGPARSMARRGLPVPPDEAIETAADGWRATPGRTRATVIGQASSSTILFVAVTTVGIIRPPGDSSAPALGLAALIVAGGTAAFTGYMVGATLMSDIGTRRCGVVLAAIPSMVVAIALGAGGDGWYNLGGVALTASGAVVVAQLLGVTWSGEPRSTALASFVAHRTSVTLAKARVRPSWSTPDPTARARESRCGVGACGFAPHTSDSGLPSPTS